MKKSDQKSTKEKSPQEKAKETLEAIKKYQQIHNKFLFKNSQTPNKFKANLFRSQNQRSNNRSGI